MIDETSRKVLGEYLKDSRQSYREVARNLGISGGTVTNRIKDLEDSRIIIQYTTKLDYEKLGYDLTVIIDIIISDGMDLEVGSEIEKINNAIGVYNVTGDSDLLVIAKFKTRKDLSEFIHVLDKMPYVVRTKTQVVLNTLKEYSPLIP